MNTLFALYFWLMQVLGVPGFTPATNPTLTATNTGHHQTVAPPPPADNCVASCTRSSFISNGF